MNTFDQLVTHTTFKRKPQPSIQDDPQILLPVFNDVGTLISNEPIWINLHPQKATIVQLDDIPLHSREAHQYDWVAYQYRQDGKALFAGVVEPSGYKTLRISLDLIALGINPFALPFDIEDRLCGYKIYSDLNRLGLDYVSEDGVCAVAIPPSFNPAVIALFKFRHPGLLYELV